MAHLAAFFGYRELLRNLVSKEVKLQYRGSVLGFFWSLLHPLLLVLIYSVAFRFIMRIPLSNYPLFILAGLLHWQFFSTATTSATRTMLSNAGLIRKLYFPRVVLPVAVVAFQGIQLLLAVAVMMLAYIPLGGEWWVGLLAYPLILILQATFAIGVALMVSVLNVFFRDLEHLVEVGLMLLFWLTPVIYNFTMVPQWAQIWFRLNPMVPFAVSYQNLFYQQEWPDPRNWLLMALWALCSLALGAYVFRRLEHRVAEEL